MKKEEPKKDVQTSETTKVQKTSSPNTAKTPVATGLLDTIFKGMIEDDDSLKQGLLNLSALPDFDSDFPKIPGKKFENGKAGFRKTSSGVFLTIACGKAMARNIALNKFVAMIEQADDPESATILVQNFHEQRDSRSARGQVLVRLNLKSCAIEVVQGMTGRVIKSLNDIANFDVYYLDRLYLTAFYLAAKAQLSNADELESMIAAYEGWKAFDIPLDPLNPYED